MKRRTFIAALGGAAAWQVVARGQASTRVRRLALLIGQSEDDPEAQARRLALERALQDLGWTQERLQVDTRFTAGDPARTRTYVTELIDLKPDIIVAHSTIAAAAALEHTHTIPILFLVVSDPVGTGLIQSLAHPGGNITGFSNFEFSIGGKWLEVLKEIAPSMRRAAIMYNPDTAPYAKYYLQSFAAAAESLLIEPITSPVLNDLEMEAVFLNLASASNSGLVLMSDIFAVVRRDAINRLTLRYGVPTINANRYITVEGGLLTYGVDTVDLFMRAASYVDRILKGEHAGELPVQAPTKYELIINLKTAKALGLEVPPTLLARADEVIE